MDNVRGRKLWTPSWEQGSILGICIVILLLNIGTTIYYSYFVPMVRLIFGNAPAWFTVLNVLIIMAVVFFFVSFVLNIKSWITLTLYLCIAIGIIQVFFAYYVVSDLVKNESKFKDLGDTTDAAIRDRKQVFGNENNCCFNPVNMTTGNETQLRCFITGIQEPNQAETNNVYGVCLDTLNYNVKTVPIYLLTNYLLSVILMGVIAVLIALYYKQIKTWG